MLGTPEGITPCRTFWMRWAYSPEKPNVFVPIALYPETTLPRQPRVGIEEFTVMIGRVRAQIKEIGIIAVMNNDFPVQEIIEAGDALLASPVLVMAISVYSPHALDAISELRRRYGEHMLIGASGLVDPAQVDDIWRHNAQFVITTDFAPAVVKQAHTRGLLIVPGVKDEADVQRALDLGCRVVHYYPAAELGGARLAQLTGRYADVDFVVGGGVNLANVAEFARTGAGALSIGNQHVPYVDWSATALITRTRALRTAWDAARTLNS